ncbi:MAG: thioredoxin family protein [Deltaproteobacteria bacterium]|jgi:thioredoxin-related protein|nr:thioredoxin family protein [Deltaproteobacteria bacterium]
MGLAPVPYREALGRAAAEGKFVLLYFWAVWCGNCQVFSEKVLSDPAIIGAINEDFIFVSIDIDKDQRTSREYKTRVVPTMVFLESDGKPASVLPGAIPGQLFAMVLSFMAGGAYKDMEFAEYFERAHPGAAGDPGGAPADAIPPAGAAAPGLAAMARAAYGEAKNRMSPGVAFCLGHFSLRCFTTNGYWAGLTLAANRLMGKGKGRWPTLTESKPPGDPAKAIP